MRGSGSGKSPVSSVEADHKIGPGLRDARKMAEIVGVKKLPAVKGSITELLPKNGLVYSEKASLGEVLCKPKLMPIRSIPLQRLEQLEERLLSENQSQTGNQ